MNENYSTEQEPLLVRMQKIFEEREKEYTLRDEEVTKRQNYLNTVAADVLKQKEAIEHRQKELADKEAALLEREEKVEQREAAYRSQQEQFVSRESEFREEMSREYQKLESRKAELEQEQHLTLEEIRTEKIRIKRECEELQREKDMLRNGTFIETDLSLYLSKEEVAANYLGKEKVAQEYVAKDTFDHVTDQLKAQLENAIQEKTDLIRRMLTQEKASDGAEEPPERTVMGGASAATEKPPKPPEYVDPAQAYPTQAYPTQAEPDQAEPNQAEPNQAELGQMQPEQTDETQEDLTAEVLYAYLKRNTHGLSNMEIYHAADSDQVLAEAGRISYRIVFGSPPYFDISVERKEDRKLKRQLEIFNNMPEFRNVKFSYHGGRVQATGYFMDSVPAYELMSHIEKISSDCFAA